MSAVRLMGLPVGQEKVVEVFVVVEKCWAGLLVELIVLQHHVDCQLVEFVVDVLFVDNKRLVDVVEELTVTLNHLKIRPLLVAWARCPVATACCRSSPFAVPDVYLQLSSLFSLSLLLLSLSFQLMTMTKGSIWVVVNNVFFLSFPFSLSRLCWRMYMLTGGCCNVCCGCSCRL